VSKYSAEAFDMLLDLVCLEISQNSVQTDVCTDKDSPGQAFCQECSLNGFNWKLVNSNFSSSAVLPNAAENN
jgi:hypothetical protein